MNNGGDTLASGRAKSATFGGPNVSQEKWDAIWSDDHKLKPHKRNFVTLEEAVFGDDECSKVTQPEKTEPTGPAVPAQSKTSKQIHRVK